jgi:Rps23 Pro-64 3,4-dihydroxylase Tpa1-like proline 4-hydroxylase
MTKDDLVGLICERITRDQEGVRQAFSRRHDITGTRSAMVTDLLPDAVAQEVYQSFPSVNDMRLLSSFRERKYTSKQLDSTPRLLRDITTAVQDARVVSLVGQITGIAHQVPDPSLYAGGISSMTLGHFLNPHLDNSHDGARLHYRVLNLLYYVTPNWQPEYGGNLELWNEKVTKAMTIPSQFNSLVIMETNRRSWHSVSPIVHQGQRCCVSNYYFSKQSPEGQDYFHVTSFCARPEQRYRRAVSLVDNLARNGLRKVWRYGLGRKDVYRPQ